MLKINKLFVVLVLCLSLSDIGYAACRGNRVVCHKPAVVVVVKNQAHEVKYDIRHDVVNKTQFSVAEQGNTIYGYDYRRPLSYNDFAEQLAEPTATDTSYFETEEAPLPPVPAGAITAKAQAIIQKNCVSCHGLNKKAGGLDLSNLANADIDEVIHRVVASGPDRMPKGKPSLSVENLQTLFEYRQLTKLAN